MMRAMNTRPITLYGISNCDTVKRARAWLAAQEQACQFIDFKKHGVPEDRLDVWLDALGWQPLLNTRGSTWRQLDAASQAGVTDATSAKALMLAQPSVIKRPVVEWTDGAVSVGFNAQDWPARIG